MFIDVLSRGVDYLQSLCEVAKVGLESKGRWQHHLLTFQRDGIGGHAPIVVDVDYEFAVWRGNVCFAGHDA